MTYEEASKDFNILIKSLEKRRQAPCGFCESFKCIPNPHECTKDDFVIDKAIEALEKQIPKKVTDIHCDEYYCPACGAENNCDQHVVYDKYCPRCGQRLD